VGVSLVIAFPAPKPNENLCRTLKNSETVCKSLHNTLATMDHSTDNLLSDIFDNALDIFDNALDIFPTDDDLNSVFPPPPAEEPSQPQIALVDPFSMPIPLEATYSSLTEAKDALQSWAA
jgi:hypothetical protein